MDVVTVLLICGLSAQVLCLQGSIVYPKLNEAEPCDHPFDLMVVLDSSGSVVPTWNNTIDFTEKLLSNFNISDDEVRVGIIEFSMVANALIPLDSGNTLGRLYQALEEARISPQNGETHTDKALYLAARIFRASPRAYTVPRVLVMMTDGELTSGNFSDLDPYISDLSSQLVETFVVVQGDDQVDEGLEKIANSKDYNHAFSLTPNSMNVPSATKALATAICNVKANYFKNEGAVNSDAKVQQSTTTIQNVGKKEMQESQQQTYALQQQPYPSQQQSYPSQQTASSTGSQLEQKQPIALQNNASTVSQISETESAGQTLYQANAWHQNLQQPIGRPKQIYPENTVPQPLPSLPSENGYEKVSDKISGSTPPTVNKAPQCNINITKVGCYRDLGLIPQPLPIRIMKENGNNFEIGVKSEKFDKEAWRAFLPDFICKCANKARESKFWTFGIQNYNECYSGPDEGRYDEDGDAKKIECIDENSNVCTENSQHCSGTLHANYIYTILSSSHKGIIRIEYD